jgi:hypothetical protein
MSKGALKKANVPDLIKILYDINGCGIAKLAVSDQFCLLFSSTNTYILDAAASNATAGFFHDRLGWNAKAASCGMGAVFGLIAAARVLTTAFGVRECGASRRVPKRPAYTWLPLKNRSCRRS